MTDSRPIPSTDALLDERLARRAIVADASVHTRPFPALEASLGITAPTPLGSGEIPEFRAGMDRMGQQLRATGHTAEQADRIVRDCAKRAHNQQGVTTRKLR